MSNYMKFVLVGVVLVIGISACTGGNTEAPEAEITEVLEEQVPASESSPSSPSTTDGESNSSSTGERDYSDLDIITLLPRDGIPAIDNPQFLSADEADEEYAPEELVIGVNFDGDARAYSIPLLSRHEIVNDTVGGKKIAVTW